MTRRREESLRGRSPGTMSRDTGRPTYVDPSTPTILCACRESVSVE